MSLVPGSLVRRVYSGHISLDSEPDWTPPEKRTMWYEKDVGIILGVNFERAAVRYPLVKVLLPDGIAFIEPRLIKEVQR